MMSPHTEKKTFDCVEMMHKGAARIRRELADLSIEEQTAYWEKSTEELRKRQARLREENRNTRKQK